MDSNNSFQNDSPQDLGLDSQGFIQVVHKKNKRSKSPEKKESAAKPGLPALANAPAILYSKQCYEDYPSLSSEEEEESVQDPKASVAKDHKVTKSSKTCSTFKATSVSTEIEVRAKEDVHTKEEEAKVAAPPPEAVEETPEAVAPAVVSVAGGALELLTETKCAQEDQVKRIRGGGVNDDEDDERRKNRRLRNIALDLLLHSKDREYKTRDDVPIDDINLFVEMHKNDEESKVDLLEMGVRTRMNDAMQAMTRELDEMKSANAREPTISAATAISEATDTQYATERGGVAQEHSPAASYRRFASKTRESGIFESTVASIRDADSFQNSNLEAQNTDDHDFPPTNDDNMGSETSDPNETMDYESTAMSTMDVGAAGAQSAPVRTPVRRRSERMPTMDKYTALKVETICRLREEKHPDGAGYRASQRDALRDLKSHNLSLEDTLENDDELPYSSDTNALMLTMIQYLEDIEDLNGCTFDPTSATHREDWTENICREMEETHNMRRGIALQYQTMAPTAAELTNEINDLRFSQQSMQSNMTDQSVDVTQKLISLLRSRKCFPFLHAMADRAADPILEGAHDLSREAHYAYGALRSDIIHQNKWFYLYKTKPGQRRGYGTKYCQTPTDKGKNFAKNLANSVESFFKSINQEADLNLYEEVARAHILAHNLQHPEDQIDALGKLPMYMRNAKFCKVTKEGILKRAYGWRRTNDYHLCLLWTQNGQQMVLDWKTLDDEKAAINLARAINADQRLISMNGLGRLSREGLYQIADDILESVNVRVVVEKPQYITGSTPPVGKKSIIHQIVPAPDGVTEMTMERLVALSGLVDPIELADSISGPKQRHINQMEEHTIEYNLQYRRIKRFASKKAVDEKNTKVLQRIKDGSTIDREAAKILYEAEFCTMLQSYSMMSFATTAIQKAKELVMESKRYKNGLWTQVKGEHYTKWCKRKLFVTKIEEIVDGRHYGNNQQNTYHVMLLAAGKYPEGPDLEASHICEDWACLEHLEWETFRENQLRKCNINNMTCMEDWKGCHCQLDLIGLRKCLEPQHPEFWMEASAEDSEVEELEWN